MPGLIEQGPPKNKAKNGRIQKQGERGRKELKRNREMKKTGKREPEKCASETERPVVTGPALFRKRCQRM